MGVSNTVNVGAATDSDNNFGVVAGNISDEADEIAHGTSSSASVPTESDTEQYERKFTGSGTAMFSGPINTGSRLTSLRLGWSLIFVNMTILGKFAWLDDAHHFIELYTCNFFSNLQVDLFSLREHW